MKDNFDYFVKEFEPAHKKYNTKNKHLLLQKSAAIHLPNYLDKNFPLDLSPRLKNGSLETSNNSEGRMFNQFSIKSKIQRRDKSRTVNRVQKDFEKKPEEIYGLNMVSPNKKTVADKLFEAKLKRHVIRGRAEKLTENMN